ncbi:MAG: hypothetical protein IRD7MM_00450 [Candidatus Midichloria mitochondrii]|uniref:hypothetical protein n=1 Tax=Candidatus Midichloria mitochondrii TaxID=234827 RepID=UPI0002FB8D59|nr:hypothetical protein [Candidatus Midichloria mitochondrii]MDJ1256683.1 hypothetical protein [Candidatus Midichloria mitochondrii]MDJ1288495.1 hypothetical protein [Candidatus Midichloria mitochondrii]MDJ1299326.1 hypothetical protein [Candidatus Midichloria mitochondrii]MDJ1313449.1 hypothetical protein [Candidatus Midichloria mitochondrii]MDJ1584033.1 hypothetical protein [Candidatus Midichloria mitochondrii]
MRLVRISDKTNSQICFNDLLNNIIKIKDDIDRLSDISRTQREALQHILVNSQGIGSYGEEQELVMAAAYKILNNYRQNVIGLAPTHKAASELKSKGYKCSRGISI